jgi:hypothetical protein
MDGGAHLEYLLHDLALPTLVLDTLCYIRAWTQEIEALGLLGPGASTDDRLHIIDCLFSATLRDTLGSHWDSLTTQFIRIFYQRTLRVANDPTFRDLLQHLHRQYGEPFLSKWNRAYDEGPERETGLSPTLPTFQQHSDYGIIRYILAHRSFAHPLSYQMITCIPYDAHSLAHYQQLYAATDARKIYYQG